MNAIELDNVTLRAGQTCLVDRVNLALPKSSRTALLGASGSGKTSLLRMIAGFVRPDSGRVWLFGKNVTDIPPERRGISMLFQEPVLFPGLTVRKNARVATGTGSKSEAKDTRIEGLAREFRIDDALDRTVRSGLSGGERQRAALVRAFSNERELLLLDEPLRGALNVELKWQLLHAIRERISATNTTTLVVTHDFAEAAYLADYIAVLHEAEIESGTADELYNRPPSLGVGLVLGPGNAIGANLLSSIQSRDGQFPLTIQGAIPTVLGDTDILFFRPEKLHIEPAESGFEITDDRFLGGFRRLTLKAPNGKELEAQVGSDTPRMKAARVSVSTSDIVVFSPVGKRRR